MPNRIWSRQNLIRNLLMGGTVLAAMVATALLPASRQEVFNGHKDLGHGDYALNIRREKPGAVVIR